MLETFVGATKPWKQATIWRHFLARYFLPLTNQGVIAQGSIRALITYLLFAEYPPLSIAMTVQRN
jgi:hypothetical protein